MHKLLIRTIVTLTCIKTGYGNTCIIKGMYGGTNGFLLLTFQPVPLTGYPSLAQQQTQLVVLNKQLDQHQVMTRMQI